MPATFRIVFRSDKPKKNGECPIYLRITQNRKTKFMSTGISVEPKYWNPEKMEIRKSHRNAKTLNQILNLKRTEAEDAYAELARHGRDNSKNIMRKIKAKKDADFFIYAENEIREKTEIGKLSQVSQTKVVKSQMEDYIGEPVLPIAQMDHHFLEGFQNYLLYQIKNKPTTIKKTFQPIKRIIRQALLDHVIHVDPFVFFKRVKENEPPEKTKLTLEQIDLLKSLDIKNGSSRWHTRNAFLFSFYSAGIRFGDVCELTWDNVKGGRLIYNMSKNGKKFSTLLNVPQKEILSQYSGERSEFIFPFLKNDVKYDDPADLRRDIRSQNAICNKNLSGLRDLANEKIEKEELKLSYVEHISFHVARHSFAQHAVNNGVTVYELKQVLRHAKIETTEKYLKSLNAEVADKTISKLF